MTLVYSFEAILSLVFMLMNVCSLLKPQGHWWGSTLIKRCRTRSQCGGICGRISGYLNGGPTLRIHTERACWQYIDCAWSGIRQSYESIALIFWGAQIILMRLCTDRDTHPSSWQAGAICSLPAVDFQPFVTIWCAKQLFARWKAFCEWFRALWISFNFRLKGNYLRIFYETSQNIISKGMQRKEQQTRQTRRVLTYRSHSSEQGFNQEEDKQQNHCNLLWHSCEAIKQRRRL